MLNILWLFPSNLRIYMFENLLRRFRMLPRSNIKTVEREKTTYGVCELIIMEKYSIVHMAPSSSKKSDMSII